jgi:hypothetical protein
MGRERVRGNREATPGKARKCQATMNARHNENWALAMEASRAFCGAPQPLLEANPKLV